MSKQRKQSTEAAVRDIRRRTRRKFSPEEKIRIVLEGLRGEQSVSELCRREGIAANLYYRWSKDFLEAGKKRLAGDTICNFTVLPAFAPEVISHGEWIAMPREGDRAFRLRFRSTAE